MATERPRRAPALEKKPDTVTCTMAKLAPEVDNSALSNYQQMGYTIKDEGWHYTMTAPTSVRDALVKQQHDRGLAQTKATAKNRDDLGGDTALERTISSVSEVNVTVNDLLGDPSDDGTLGP